MQRQADMMQCPIVDTSLHEKLHLFTHHRLQEDIEPYIATMKKQDPETLAHLPAYQLGEGQDDSIDITHDAVFGAITINGPNYRNASSTPPWHQLMSLTTSRWGGWARPP